MADGFPRAQQFYDNQLPPYLEAEDRPCDECGVPGEDHCEDCGDCDCTCDDEEDA
jgi:hypothetical protein